MRLLYIVDGRSPIALNWIDYFLGKGFEVHIVSTYPCEFDPRFASSHFVPVAFSGYKKQTINTGKQSRERKVFPVIWGASLLSARTRIRQWLGPVTLFYAARKLSHIIEEIKPDIIHAMRIPYEGMLSAFAKHDIPLIISVWGNDFTLHAKSSFLLNYLTRYTLKRADALHTDCHRDIQLAYDHGFSKHRPFTVLPGAGGIHPQFFYSREINNSFLKDNQTDLVRSRKRFTVINPRGFRAYVRNDVFFQAIPMILSEKPDTQFVCPNMLGEAKANEWVDKLGILENVNLLPKLDMQEMANLFRSAQIAVSPSTHDGTPNTLLEAMACGCFPIAGDLDSIREWITSEENGLLVDPTDPQSISKAIIRVIKNENLRKKASIINHKVIQKKALYPVVMKKAEEFYLSLLDNRML